MARPSKEPPSPSSLVPAIVRHARSRGLDIEALVWRFDLPPDVIEREEVSVAADTPDELLQSIARTGAGPDVALRVATELTSRRHALAELVVRASATVRDALVRLARWAPMIHEGLHCALSEDGAQGAWVLRTPRRPRGVGRFVHELALAHAVAQARAAAGDDFAAARVWFVHARAPDLDSLHAFFATKDLTFGCEDCGFALPLSILERPMRAADARTVETIEPIVEGFMGARPRGSSLAHRVAAHLTSTLPGDTDAHDVARAMHMSTRTLQRRLEDEQTRFTEVLDGVRLEVARRLLADPAVTLAEVAFRLGFADLATFSRAFKRWTGKPPGQWRRS
jgi:AraC-like DNA-binding protein